MIMPRQHYLAQITFD